MKPETMRVLIAQSCGWKRGTVTQEQSAFYGTPLTTPAWFPPDGRDWEDIECPDYLNDLNAMHEAEIAQLGTSGWYEYERNLVRIATLPSYAQGVVCASAAQRAEAFLRTIGKWEEA